MSLLIVIGFILIVLGFIGCILPVLPGPILSWAAVLLLSIATEWEAFSPLFLVTTAVLAVLVSVFDNILPIITSRGAGGSKAATAGGVLGMLLGMFFFPPFGILIGTLLGAIGGELIANPQGGRALSVGWGVFVGTILGVLLKLVVAGYLAWTFIRAVIQLQ